ncbi:MAG: hypothetical protein KZQ58_12205 [gamma proteobacterium symbiont of Bathyaustriella thionipta]|nr:hypothetical protein [gamma proteobacterium symbiont of Bathyaustriella thionipta]
MTYKHFFSVSLLTLACSVQATEKQTVYIQKSSGGVPQFSDKPSGDAPVVETLEIQNAPVETNPSVIDQQRRQGIRDNKNISRDIDKRIDARRNARREVEQAKKALSEARKAQESGKTPLPGERKGTTTGANRLTEKYQQRQDALAAQVQAAEARLKQAEKKQADLR